MSFTLLSSISLQLFNPQVLRYFIDTALAGGSQQALFAAALLFITVALITQVLTVAATYFGENVAWTATNALRGDLTEHCLELDLAFHKAHTPGELIERVDGDVNTLSRFFSQFTIYVLGNAILLGGILGVLFYENWRAGLGLTLFALTSLVILVGMRSYAIPYWGALRQVSAEFFGFLGEHLAGTEDIRSNGAISYIMRRFHALLQGWLPIYHQARLAGTVLWGSTVGLFTLGNAIALAVGAYLWSRDAITIGTVFLIFYYTDLLNKPIEQIRVQLEDLHQAEASIHRIQELFRIQSNLSSGGQHPLPAGALSVTFDHVWFSYDDGCPGGEEAEAEEREWTLQDVSFYLPPGEVLGLLGRTGSGKTTLARLLLRLYEPQSGVIRLGNTAVDQPPLQALRQRVGLVTQDVQLFQSSVRDNLSFFNPRIRDDKLQGTLELLGLSDWLHTLPQGLDTQLGADSGGLSTGQAQLLAFARIFIKDPGLVILDEASSRLDPSTEILIERALDWLLRGRTGIIIAHRLATVQRADRILIVENGRIIEYGHRQTLADAPNSRFAGLLRTSLTDALG